MTWPEDRLTDRPEWPLPEGYALRVFREGDEEAYLELMHSAGFDGWTREYLDDLVKKVKPGGIFFVEPAGSSQIVATAMGWYRPHEVFPDAHEMGWVAAAPPHRGRGLGKVVICAATRALLEQGATTIYLLTDDWRVPAIKSYLRIGYVPFCANPEMKKRWDELSTEHDLDLHEFAGAHTDAS